MVEAKQQRSGYDLALKLEQRKADRIFNKEEVAKHNTAEDAWVIVDGIVYDITDLIEEHPGGIDIVAGKLGRDITETMKNPKIHQHSKAAYTMLDLYRIGRLESTAKPAYDERPLGWGPIDFTKPILHQVGCMGKAYNDWVQNDPIHFKEPVTLFGHPALEYFTHVKWWNVPLHWVPITLIGLLYSLKTVSYGIIPFTLILALGFVLWVLLEYNLHKHLFHNIFLATKGWYVTNVVHFITHGFHHKVPMDKDRLVAPFSFALLVGGPIIGSILYLFPLPIALNILTGVYIGYMFYDLTHYSLHHASNPKLLPFPFNWIFSTKTFQALRTHHVIHHFAPGGHDNNFGISNQTIDIVMSSLQREHYKKE